jgi:hypothetical protein
MINSISLLLLSSFTYTAETRTCDSFLFKLVESSSQYRIDLKKIDARFPNHGKVWHHIDHSNKKVDDHNYEPALYNIEYFVSLSEDEDYGVGSYSFDPATDKLYISLENKVDGRGQMKLVKEINYKRKWLRKFLKCQGKR